MKTTILAIAFIAVLFQSAIAQDIRPFGLQCSGVEANDLKKCLAEESGKIDEANRPNEIILSTESTGKESLLRLANESLQNKSNIYAEKLKALIPVIESSVATALIIQYEIEPQLYYYVVDKDGKLEVIFDGLNSVDILNEFSNSYKNEADLFYLKSPVVSKTFKDWLDFLKNDNKL